jgi:uncharacterized protein
MKTLAEILSMLERHKPKLYEKYPIKSLAIFGSYARRENNDNSDLDLMVEFKDKVGIKFIELAEEIEQIVGLKVDLVSRKGIKEKYYKSIHNDLIYV